jgi:hypothetical protein
MVNTRPIKEALAYAYKMTDLKKDKWPTGLDDQILIDFIIGAYGGLCSEEIKYAFKLGCKGDLEIDMNHFQAFTPIYIGKVLKAYSSLRSKQLARTQSKQLTDFSEEQIDRKQYYEEYLFMKYDALLKGKYIFTEEDERHLYRKLTEGLHIKIATNSEKISAMEDAEEQEQKKFRQNEQERENKVKARAKRICFRNWITDLAEEKFDLRTEINKLI